jgi:hypothetical protein
MTIGGGVIQHTHLSATSGGILPPETSAFILIQRQVIAAPINNVTFSALTDFDNYFLDVFDCLPVNNGVALYLQVSIAGVFQIAGYAAMRPLWQVGFAPAAPAGGEAEIGINLATAQSNVLGHAHFRAHILGLRNLSSKKAIGGTGYWKAADGTIRGREFGGYYNGSDAAIDGFRVVYDAGQVARGTFALHAARV